MSISRPIAGDRCGFCGTAAAGDHDVGLAAAVSAATYEQQKEQAVRSLLPPNTTFSAVAFDVFGSPDPSAAAWLKKMAGPLAAQRYVATSVATGWLRLWFATAIGSMVAAAVATNLRLQALAPG